MPRYLCIAAVWVEGEDADVAADRINERLSGDLRADGTVGRVTIFEKRETFKDGFVIDLERFDLGDVVAGVEQDDEKGKDADE